MSTIAQSLCYSGHSMTSCVTLKTAQGMKKRPPTAIQEAVVVIVVNYSNIAFDNKVFHLQKSTRLMEVSLIILSLLH